MDKLGEFGTVFELPSFPMLLARVSPRPKQCYCYCFAFFLPSFDLVRAKSKPTTSYETVVVAGRGGANGLTWLGFGSSPLSSPRYR